MNIKTGKKLATVAGLFLLGAQSASAATIGGFTFNDSQFGDTLIESDGGAYRNAHWLNIINSNPGNPGALTGANFDTGIANIGLTAHPVYTIGYNSAIANTAGDDLGIVAARFSSDTFDLAVSTDGVTFTAPISFGPASGVNTGVGRTYFYEAAGVGNGPFDATLFVTPIDLSVFGLSSGETISAVRITSMPQGDLIRIAGLNPTTTSVPDAGSTLSLLGGGLALLAGFYRNITRP